MSIYDSPEHQDYAAAVAWSQDTAPREGDKPHELSDYVWLDGRLQHEDDRPEVRAWEEDFHARNPLVRYAVERLAIAQDELEIGRAEDWSEVSKDSLFLRDEKVQRLEGRVDEWRRSAAEVIENPGTVDDPRTVEATVRATEAYAGLTSRDRAVRASTRVEVLDWSRTDTAWGARAALTAVPSGGAAPAAAPNGPVGRARAALATPGSRQRRGRNPATPPPATARIDLSRLRSSIVSSFRRR